MTDLEISKALALAIGWTPEHMRFIDGKLYLQEFDEYFARPFDYRDWNVIGPIAEKYFAFPSQFVDGDGKVISWEAGLYSETRGRHVPFSVVKADTPQKAIALAVIGAAK